MVIKKEILNKVNLLSETDNNFGWEDFDTWIRCAMITDNFSNINKPLGYCWTGEGTISSLDQTLISHKFFIKQYGNLIKDKFKLQPDKLWWIAYNEYFYNYKVKNYRKQKILLKSIYKSPLKIKMRIIFMKIFFFTVEIFRLKK